MAEMEKPKDLNPLIPLDELKAFVAKVVSVPKAEIDRREADYQVAHPKRKADAKRKRGSGPLVNVLAIVGCKRNKSLRLFVLAE